MEKALTYRWIDRYTYESGFVKKQDAMIIENPLRVFVNDSYYKTIFCAPIHLEDLIIGHLAVEKVITSYKQIKVLQIQGNTARVLTGQGTCESIESGAAGARVMAQDIIHLMKQHVQISQIHQETGAVHSMSVGKGAELLFTREDIGRHNAVDKVFGYCLKNNVNCRDKVFLSSGRITAEILDKIRMMNFQIIVTRAAVTDLAAGMAEEAGVTVAGFARNERFNVYSHPERISGSDSR